MRGRRSRRSRSGGSRSPGASACAETVGASASSRRRRSCGTASPTCRTPRRASTPSTSQTGRRLWVHRRQEPNDGPNGLALVGDRLYARQRHVGVRARRLRRPPALEHAAREPDGAVRQHHAGRRSRPGLREHRRAPARWPGSDLRARRGHGKAALAVRHDQGAMAEPDGRRRRRLGAAERRRGADVSTRASPTRPRGAARGGSRTAAGTAGRRSTPTRSSSSTAPAGISSGTTRCFRTTSGTTTSSSRPSSQRWRDETS